MFTVLILYQIAVRKYYPPAELWIVSGALDFCIFVMPFVAMNILAK